MEHWIGGAEDKKECLFYAVANNNADLYSYLIEEVGLVADLEEMNKEGMNLLHIAAKKGNDRIIYLICDGARDVNQVTEKNGETALHLAIEAGHESSVRFLLSFDPDVNKQDVHGVTPLMKAVQAGSVRATKDLLMKGAKKETVESNNRKAVDFVDELQDAAVQKQLKKALVSIIDLTYLSFLS